jgi:flagellin-specific chaperone FliS
MLPTSQHDVAEYYGRLRIETSSAKNSIYLLHEKAVHLLSRALYFTDGRRAALDRVQNIVTQLQLALIVDDPVGKGLFFIYGRCYRLLEHDDWQSMLSAHKLLSPLKDTFRVLLTRP